MLVRYSYKYVVLMLCIASCGCASTGSPTASDSASAIGGTASSRVASPGDNYTNITHISNNYYNVTYTDNNNKELSGFTDMEVLAHNILDNEKGYLRIKIKKDYLNSTFATPTPINIRIQNENIQPITVVYDSDKTHGPGIFVILPYHKKREVFYLADFLQFKNMGKIIYEEDFVFEIYYNNISFYFITTSGAIKLEPLPYGTKIIHPIKIGPNLITRPFDQKSYITAMKMFPQLAAYFNMDYSNFFPDLYSVQR